MLQLTLNDLLGRLVAFAVISALFGLLVTVVSRLLGDRGPAQDGRQTLNPLEQADLLAAVPFVLFETGWIKPVALEPRLLKPGAVSGSIVLILGSLAALFTIVAVVWGVRIVAHTTFTDATGVAIVETTLRAILDATAWFLLLNLLPIPPLAGGYVLQAIAPRSAEVAMRYSLVVRIVIIAALFTGWPQSIARPAYLMLLGWAGTPA
jgi:Zn-dependent protease